MTEDVLDLAALLAPLDSGVQGAGADLRVDFSPASVYQRLRDLHASARAEERARDAQDEVDVVNPEGWRDLLDVGQRALATQSKDFEIAAWLTEALVRLHGLPGLVTGAKLIAGICEGFWEGGFPQPDEEGLLGRASPIGGLSGVDVDGTIMQPLRRLTLFRRVDGTGLSLYQWDQAENTAGLADDRRQARYAAGVPEMAVLEVEAKVDNAYLCGTGRQSLAALDAWRDMERTLDNKFAGEAPSLRKVTALLERLGEVVVRLGGTLVATGPAAEQTMNDMHIQGNVNAAAPLAAATARGALAGREDALRELDRIAEFFRRTEPHSPLAYTLEEAVRRGRMTLAELLMEVLPEDEARKAMLMRLGMRSEQPPA